MNINNLNLTDFYELLESNMVLMAKVAHANKLDKSVAKFEEEAGNVTNVGIDENENFFVSYSNIGTYIYFYDFSIGKLQTQKKFLNS